MHNQQFQSNYGNYGTSQYQGFQKQYQPVGTVQSFYGQNQQQSGSSSSSASYHTANYRGNQVGHDASLRGDSFTPAQQQGGWGGTTSGAADYSSARYGIRGNEAAYSGANNVSSQSGFSQSPYQAASRYGSMGATSFGQSSYAQGASSQGSYAQGSFPSAQSYHTANYRGNQIGHDASLRGDSFTPAQQQGGFGGAAANYGSMSSGMRGNEAAFSGNNNVSQQFGFNNAY
jgi:hypothetical protein